MLLHKDIYVKHNVVVFVSYIPLLFMTLHWELSIFRAKFAIQSLKKKIAQDNPHVSVFALGVS